MIAVAFNTNLVKSPSLSWFSIAARWDAPDLTTLFISPSRLGYIITQSWADDFNGALSRDVMVMVCYAQIATIDLNLSPGNI